LRFTQEDRNEESKGYLAESPSKEYNGLNAQCCHSKDLELEYLDSEDEEQDHSCQVESKVKAIVNDPVVRHTHAVNLHIFNQSSFLLKDDLIDEDWKSHAKANWHNHHAHDAQAALNLGLKVGLEGEELDSADYCDVIE